MLVDGLLRHCVPRNDEAGHEFPAMMLQAAMGIVTAFLAMTKCQRVHCNDKAGHEFPAMMLQAAYVYRHCERSAAIPIS